jgi:hypothetical protein
MLHSKTSGKTELSRAKSRANGLVRPRTVPPGSTRGGTKQEAVLALLRQSNPFEAPTPQLQSHVRLGRGTRPERALHYYGISPSAEFETDRG